MAALPVHFFHRIIGGMVAVSILAWGICEPVRAEESARAPEPESAVTQAERLIESGQTAEAKQILASALKSPGEHAPAYVRLVQLAIAEEDSAALQTLFARHRAFLFEAPEEFRRRLNVYELRPLRRRYNEAIQAAMNRSWTDAERGFAMLLGDGAFHVQATAWLFRVAMQQRDFSKARFLADLARALGRRHAYDGPEEARVAVQRAVYLAMIRLHVELDQCFLHGMNSPSEARPLFPDLQDQVLAYLARR